MLVSLPNKKGFSLHCQAVFQDPQWTFMTTMFSQPVYGGEGSILRTFLLWLWSPIFTYISKILGRSQKDWIDMGSGFGGVPKQNIFNTNLDASLNADDQIERFVGLIIGSTINSFRTKMIFKTWNNLYIEENIQSGGNSLKCLPYITKHHFLWI